MLFWLRIKRPLLSVPEGERGSPKPMAAAPGGDQPKKGSLFGGLFGKKDKHAEPEKVMEISGPTGFQRGIHIDHNKDDGTFSVPYPLAGPAIAQPYRVALWAGT